MAERARDAGAHAADGSRGATGGGVTMRRLFIAGEVALSVVLLVGAGLLVRSFTHLRGVNPGIDLEGGLSFKISLPSLRYDDDPKAAAFFSEAVNRLRDIPGVAAAGATARLALEGYTWTGDLFVDGRPDVWGRELRHKAVTPGFLQAPGSVSCRAAISRPLIPRPASPWSRQSDPRAAVSSRGRTPSASGSRSAGRRQPPAGARLSASSPTRSRTASRRR